MAGKHIDPNATAAEAAPALDLLNPQQRLAHMMTMLQAKYGKQRRDKAAEILGAKAELTDEAINGVCKQRPLFADADVLGPGWMPADGVEGTTLVTSWREPNLLEELPDLVSASGKAKLAWVESLPFAQALAFKFLLSRAFDVDSASDRMLNLRKVFITEGLVWNADHADVQAGLSSGAFHFSCPLDPKEKRPVIAILPRKFDWTKMTNPQAKRTIFYCQMCAVHSAPTAQVRGAVLTNSMKDYGYSNVNTQLVSFITTLVSSALPIKINAGFIANQPWIFGSILWPLMKNGLSTKVSGRMKVLGSDYKPAHEALDLVVVPTELGGKRDLDSDAARKAAKEEVDLRPFRLKKESRKSDEESQTLIAAPTKSKEAAAEQSEKAASPKPESDTVEDEEAK